MNSNIHEKVGWITWVLELHSFWWEPVKLDPRLGVLNIFVIFRVYCSYFFPIYFKSSNVVIIGNTRNRSYNVLGSQKEKKNVLMLNLIQSVQNHGTK